MDSDTKFSLAVIAIGLALMAGFVVVALVMESVKCTNKWHRSGLRSDYQIIGGCMVERKDGTWVPASAIRDVSV